MRIPRVALALALALAPPTLAEEIDPEGGARAFVDQTIHEVLGVLKDETLSEEQQRRQIEKIANVRFDFPTVTRLVLARNWKKLSEAEREAFMVEFRRHLSLTYSSSLDEYKNEEVVITRSRLEKNGDVTVRTKIIGASADPIIVDYRLRKRDATWHAIDVITESVSMISNFRTQTREIISEAGPQGLIEKLREKNDSRESKAGAS